MTANHLNYLSAGLAFFAAILWFVSATVQVKAKDKVSADGWIEASLESYGNDVIESAKLQQKWSRRGAYAAAAAAAIQGFAILVSSGAN
ncbi:hypothetical protein [Rubrivivax gelatinosus]|uniref:hypothetical protein n=1 Tax=Rubrivivax gelatinosus TaxID=28068 RepID=UPI0019038257|nr:hypothetical protein [Rubrivivax gelatinosus]